jgi:hypothetical protein
MIAMMIGCSGLVCTLLFLVVLYGMTESFATILHDSRRPLLHGNVQDCRLYLVTGIVEYARHYMYDATNPKKFRDTLPCSRGRLESCRIVANDSVIP